MSDTTKVTPEEILLAAFTPILYTTTEVDSDSLRTPYAVISRTGGGITVSDMNNQMRAREYSLTVSVFTADKLSAINYVDELIDLLMDSVHFLGNIQTVAIDSISTVFKYGSGYGASINLTLTL